MNHYLKETYLSLFKENRYPALDGLRAFAILLVFMTHTAQHVPGLSFSRSGHEWLFFLYNGWMGVDLFFALSGFLIVDMLLVELKRENAISFRRFYLKRAFRILPAFYIVILMIVLGLAGPAYYVGKPAFSSVDILMQMVFLCNYYIVPVVGFGWSLSIEEQFYIIVHCCSLLAGRFCLRQKYCRVWFLFCFF